MLAGVSFSSLLSRALAALFALLTATALVGPAPAAATVRAPTCDGRPGRTLAASELARLYLVRTAKRPRKPGTYLCAHGSQRTTLLFSGRSLPDAYGLRGVYAFALYDEGASEDGQDSGVFYTDVWVASARRSRLSFASTAGVGLSDLVISDNGIVAARADSKGNQQYSTNGPPEQIEPTSAITMFDSHAIDSRNNGDWTTITSAPPGSFTHLAATADAKTLIWTRADGTAGTTPFLPASLGPTNGSVTSHASGDLRDLTGPFRHGTGDFGGAVLDTT